MVKCEVARPVKPNQMEVHPFCPDRLKESGGKGSVRGNCPLVARKGKLCACPSRASAAGREGGKSCCENHPKDIAPSLRKRNDFEGPLQLCEDNVEHQ